MGAREANSIYVFGGSTNEAAKFITDLMLPPAQYKVGQGARDLRGTRRGAVILIGSYMGRRDYAEIMRELEIRECRILGKIADW